jgi:SLOG cluster2/TIR domain
MQPIPLRLFLLAHPSSSSAGLLAQELMRRFFDPPASGGLRLPVFFTADQGDGMPPSWEGPEGINFGESAHTLVVVLADARMARRVSIHGEAGTGGRWQQFLAEGAVRAPVGSSPHHVFGVAIAKARDEHDGNDDTCFALGESRHMLGVKKEPGARGGSESLEDYGRRIECWLQEAAEEIALQITIRAIRLLEEGMLPADAPPEMQAPVRLFLSHAKADLKSNESDAVRNVEASIKELPIQAWFDAAKIRPGAEFEKEIVGGLQDCSVLIAFLTDQYASRPWCQREILEAKRLGAPILVVDALASGEPRNFPYLGNVPTLRWVGQNPVLEARRIVCRAVREALKFKHNRASLKRWADPGETLLASAPEGLTLAWQSTRDSATTHFIYPDPPLVAQELSILQGLRSNTEFLTPLSKIARKKMPDGVRCIALATSASNEKNRLGLSRMHEESLFDEMHLYFLLAGLQIAYGGALQVDTTMGTNFTHRLFELVRGYSAMAKAAGAGALKPILNFAPWPLRLTYGEEEVKLFGVVADLVEGNRPPMAEVPEGDADLFPAGQNIFALPDSAERRLAWTRGLTAMRLQMTQETQARVVVGGTLAGFRGIYPGVFEEAWMSVVSRKPMYLIGAFGGAARAVIDLLNGRERPDLGTAGLTSTIPNFQASVDLAIHRGLMPVEVGKLPELSTLNLGGKLVLPDRMVNDLKEAGRAGLAKALCNGLNDEKNRELFRSSDPARIAELVLMGLSGQ